MPISLIVAASALLSLAAAAPVQDAGSLKARQAPNCNLGTQVTAPYDSSCWNTLNIQSYLTNWKATTPTCTDAETSAGAGQTLSCCVASEPWSTCFLRLATKSNNYTCTQLVPDSCTFPAQLDPGLDPTIASQVNYVVLSIMMINAFFVSYSHSLQTVISADPASLMSFLSNSPASSINSQKVSLNSQNTMAALTLGLPFAKFSTPHAISVSNDGTTVTSNSVSKRDPQDPTGTSTGPAPQSSGCNYSWLASYFQSGGHHRRQAAPNCPQENPQSGSASAQIPANANSNPVIIFNQALQQSSNVAAAMWPSSLNSATTTLSNIGSGQFLNQGSLTTILTAGLNLIMTDIPTFIAFGGNGIFSTPLAPADEPSSYTRLGGALDTFLVSQMLQSNSISATPLSVVASNPCAGGAALCDSSSSYWSPVTNRAYTLSGSNAYALIKQAASSTEVDLGVLFDGAYNCTFAGLAGGSVVSVAPDSSLNVACLSVLPMYIMGDCPDGATYVGGKCPFGHR